jgi:hypothetical protein
MGDQPPSATPMEILPTSIYVSPVAYDLPHCVSSSFPIFPSSLPLPCHGFAEAISICDMRDIFPIYLSVLSIRIDPTCVIFFLSSHTPEFPLSSYRSHPYPIALPIDTDTPSPRPQQQQKMAGRRKDAQIYLRNPRAQTLSRSQLCSQNPRITIVRVARSTRFEGCKACQGDPPIFA